MSALLIDALGNTTGGGLVVLRQTLEALLPTRRVIVCHSPGVSLPDDPNLIARSVSLAQPLPGRLAWALGGVGASLQLASAGQLLSLNGVGLFEGACPQVVLIQQPLLYDLEGLAMMPPAFVARMAVLRALTIATCRRARAIIVQTEQVAASVVKHLGLPQEKLHVLSPTLPALAPTLPRASHDHAPTLLYVGHHAPYKNTAILPKLMAALWAKLPQARLMFTGQPPWRRGLHDARLIALGQLPHAQLLGVMRSASALVMPSVSETVGLPLLEAMSLGLPIIAAERPYAREICADAAFYAPHHDADAFASCAYTLLADPDLWRARALASQSRAAALKALPLRSWAALPALLDAHR